ncbi:MAG: hypothetical protein ACRDZ9_04665 [Acidimicrobiales bacterium]
MASRIGAVRGDVVGIEIVDRGGGQAVDELVVDLPGAELVDLLVSEVTAVDGVAVEEVRVATDVCRDPRLDALEMVAALVAATTEGALFQRLAEEVRRAARAGWVAVVTPDRVGAGVGPVPAWPWLRAFVDGSPSSEPSGTGPGGPDEVAWAPMASAGCTVVLGRPGRPVRGKERRQLEALARIADARWADLARGSAGGAPVGWQDRKGARPHQEAG